ncbi:hypothetical protein PFFCH_04457 [Plasmodium falciparum FCH/4]|uniref:Uncharacterized protein n=1 Tax=Plasmodium falciparum FCH/4 TaxID=1036724 RepID=A0A024VJL8_PLAFA|nr:hypothetical protein PFFCH_04457 [Plasmodium falciparum FCH/4]
MMMIIMKIIQVKISILRSLP